MSAREREKEREARGEREGENESTIELIEDEKRQRIRGEEAQWR